MTQSIMIEPSVFSLKKGLNKFQELKIVDCGYGNKKVCCEAKKREFSLTKNEKEKIIYTKLDDINIDLVRCLAMDFYDVENTQRLKEQNGKWRLDLFLIIV